MIVAMKVLLAEKHPNADRLRRYIVQEGLTKAPLQICANLSNIYEVGDIAVVSMIGHKFKTGDSTITIFSRKVRGVLSQGMMLGKTESDSGIDLTEEYKGFDPMT